MCNLVTIPSSQNIWVINFFDGNVPEWIELDPPHMVSAYARPTVPIVLPDGRMVPASWTYLPPPPDDKKKEMGWMVQTFNTKAEEMFDKRTWTDPARNRRAVVPVVAYHEHQHRGKARIPYRFHSTEDRVFLLAGVWKLYEDEGLYRFSILTKVPNRLNRWVHNSNPRQPVVIPPEFVNDYLKGTTPESVAPFLVPDENDGITAEPGVGLNGLAPENPPPPPAWDDAPAEGSKPKPGELEF